MEDLSYNNRLQTTQYELKTQANARVMGREYQYTTTPTSTDNDGRVKYSRDLVSNNLDRIYTYDHTGQLQSAKAGVLQQNGYFSYYSGPFEQSYTNDVWGNLVGRTWRTFASYSGYTYPQQNGYTDSYVNNKNTASGWQYDANGSLLTSTNGSLTRQYTYDAAGTLLTSSEPGKNITQSFDGDGQRVKFVENSTTTYYVRSSVLGGQTITEVDQSGVKKRGYVYAGGQMIAKQENSQVLWEHSDPSGESNRTTNSAGVVTSKVETDPLGTQVDDTANYNYSGYTSYNSNPAGFYGAGDQPRDCAVRGLGVAVPCSMVNRRALGWGIGILRSDGWVQSSSYVDPNWVDRGGGWHYDKPRPFTNYSFTHFGWGYSHGGGTTTHPPVSPPQNPTPCETYLANLFGDKGAYFADVDDGDPVDLTVIGGANGGSRPPAGLERHVHLYGSENDATKMTNVYIPAGGTILPLARESRDEISNPYVGRTLSGDATYMLAYFKQLGSLRNVTLAIFHIADFKQQRQKDGRIRVGTLGGYDEGGPWTFMDKNGNYTKGKHVHLDLWRGRYGSLPARERRPSIRAKFSGICPPSLR